MIGGWHTTTPADSMTLIVAINTLAFEQSHFLVICSTYRLPNDDVPFAGYLVSRDVSRHCSSEDSLIVASFLLKMSVMILSWAETIVKSMTYPQNTQRWCWCSSISTSQLPEIRRKFDLA